MQPVSLHSLSELERASLQELALYQLQEKLLVGDLSLAKVGPKGSKSIRQKLESFSKEKKDYSPQTFGIPLFQVIANDRAYKQLQETVKSSRRLCLEVEATVTNFRAQMQKRSQLGRSCWMVPCEIFPEEPLSPAFPDHSSSWSQRRGAMSVDSITDLSDNSSKLLEALQLSHPHELDPRRSLGKKKMLSLNPITWQVPRIVDRCCKHIETYGLQTVGIFRVGSSKKRVQQIPGNKMTVSNLATVFGPNILQKEKPGEKDSGAKDFEDSTAIILVVQRLIEHYQTLFMSYFYRSVSKY